MKTYTSESVFLLTTFVNMARSRLDNNPEECNFINVVSQEIFQVSYVKLHDINTTVNKLTCSVIIMHLALVSFCS